MTLKKFLFIEPSKGRSLNENYNFGSHISHRYDKFHENSLLYIKN